MDDMPSRVAVLEQIARETLVALQDLRAEIRGLRTDMQAGFAAQRSDMLGEVHGLRGELGAQRTESRADYRWLLGIMLGGFGALLAVMAHGFHWL
jgi:hypothetical protein